MAQETVDQPDNSRQDLIRKNRNLRMTNRMLLLTIAGGLLLFLLYRPKKFDFSEIGEKRFGPVDPEIAKKNMGIYRQKGAYASLSLYPDLKVMGVLHDTTEFADYLTKHFKRFSSTHTPMQNCVWQIGVYPMVCKETVAHPNKPRIGVYFIPTMVDTTLPPSQGIKDYLSIINHRTHYIYYLKDAQRPQASRALLNSDDYIFDEGHLWP